MMNWQINISYRSDQKSEKKNCKENVWIRMNSSNNNEFSIKLSVWRWIDFAFFSSFEIANMFLNLWVYNRNIISHTLMSPGSNTHLLVVWFLLSPEHSNDILVLILYNNLNLFSIMNMNMVTKARLCWPTIYSIYTIQPF